MRNRILFGALWALLLLNPGVIFADSATPNTTFVLKRLNSFGGLGFGDGQLHKPGHILGVQQSLFVIDTHNQRIQRFRPDGVFEYSFKKILDEDGQNAVMDEPFGLAADNRGALYVTDVGANVIYVFDFNGRYQKTLGGFGLSGAKFNQPRSAAVDLQGFLYVADTGNHRILKLDGNGTPVFEIPTVEGGLRSPLDIRVDDNNQIYVLDGQGIKTYDELGRFHATVLKVESASAFAQDKDRTYVAFDQPPHVEIYDKNYRLIFSVDAGLKKPVAVFAQGNHLYVSDAGLNEVIVYEMD
jgi:DNA-binding beta-propeller fold protein YncE